MNAPVRPSPPTATTTARGLPLPVTLGGSRGWLHRGRSRRGVLMVGAQGFEAFCAYQSWRVFADLLAEAGLTALRFDLPGEGDSLGNPHDPAQVAEWVACIRNWHDYLQAEVGLDDIAVVGLRLGCLLAKAALHDAVSLRKMALLAPPQSGAAYARELRIAALLSSAAKPGSGVDDSGVDLCGHLQTPETLRDITALGVLARGFRPGVEVLVAHAPEADPESVAEPLRAEARAVATLPFDGLADLLVGPTASRTPWTTLEETTRWLADGADHATFRLQAPPGPDVDGGMPSSGRLAAVDFDEIACQFGRNAHLAGILCRPANPRAGAHPVLFLNSGANPHAGWARAHVDQARALARDGIASLRMDASGIGDSLWYREGPRPVLYSTAHTTDIRDAVDMLVALGLGAPVVVGLCAGAHGAITALAGDTRLVHAIAVNPLRFHWSADDTLDAAEASLNQSARVYSEKIMQLGDWRRLLTGQIRPGKVLAAVRVLGGTVMRRIATPFVLRFGLSFPASPVTRHIRQMFIGFERRGARLDLVYGENDAGRDELDRHFGADAQLLRSLKGIRLLTVTGTDHELTPRHARDAVLERIRQASMC